MRDKTKKIANHYKPVVAVGLALMFCLVLATFASAMDTEECLGCHTDSDMVDVELLVDAGTFEHTVHAELGCVTCHDSVTDEHPDDGNAVSSADCLDCHGEVGEQYMHTTHAENASCVDCHDPHNAFGLEKASAEVMNQQCQQCHDNYEVVSNHAEWLPQAELHIAKLPCITCHTAAEGYEVVLNITHKAEQSGNFTISSYEELSRYNEADGIKHLIDINRDDFISLAELRSFNRNPTYAALRLEGTLVPDAASHVLSTHDNRYDCSFCHASGPESMQTSFLALPNPNGSFERMNVEKGAVLDALYGTPDFYLTGSSRNAALNIIGFAIICGGFIMPIGHGSLRFLTRNNRKH